MTIDYMKEQSPDVIETEMSKKQKRKRFDNIMGKYVIMTRTRRGIVFMIDQTIHTTFKNKYWANLLCNAKGYDTAQEAYDRIEGITNGACVFKVCKGYKLVEVTRSGNRKR